MKKVYVIGHRNPDTDSICSAIAYANLKNQVEGNGYEAYRAGNITAKQDMYWIHLELKIQNMLVM